jgi:transposase
MIYELKEELIMILNNQIITDIKIKSVNDLYKLKPFLEDGTLKINKSQIARELEVDRRTVDKYINGYTKPETRDRDDCITPFYDVIAELLSDKNQQIFYYRKVLWQYLVDNHEYNGVYCNFCHYLKKYPEFDSYFRKSRHSNTDKVTIRYETPMGKQAQLDWKESIPFTLSSGETIDVNIFVLLLSFSRFRVYRVSLTKTQDILFSFLDDAFETFGGVPDEIVTDNMKTVMDQSRTEYFEGKVNNKFRQFADDYGFKVQPCIAGRPRTKAKVEAPMKVLDEIRAYNGKLNYRELVELVIRINDRVNTQVNQGTGRIPVMYFQKEKTFLHSLPADNIRKPYQITTNTVKVNHSSMFNYKGCQYSVPPEYTGRIVSLQVYDGYIHVYCNTDFVTIHQLSSKKLNYISEHYAAIAMKSHVFKDEHIMDRAKENLEIIGKVYGYE